MSSDNVDVECEENKEDSTERKTTDSFLFTTKVENTTRLVEVQRQDFGDFHGFIAKGSY